MSTSTIAPGLARKVKKILEIKADGDVAQTLRTLSSFYTDNSASSRRALRSIVERRALDLSSDFLASADEVIEALDRVQESLDDLGTSCGRIFDKVASSRAPVAEVLSESEQLTRELRTSEVRLRDVEGFLAAYQLSPEDLRALRDLPVGEAFFRSLERISAIHANCRALLRTEHQRAGLELMDAMSKHQEVAYERLCRWVQEHCRALGDSDASDTHPLLQTATHFLKERPILFRYCAEEVTTARHASLFQRFINALTKGGPGGVPKPIEIHAGDPKRYIGDILAWIHQAVASERDLLVSLFGEDARGEGEGEGAAPASADLPSVAAMLDRVFEAVTRPLKVRVEQVLLSSPSLLLAFKLQSLLRFYQGTVGGILGAESALGNAMLSLCLTAERVCREQLRAHGERMARRAGGPSADLAPPPELAETVQMMGDLVEEAAMGAGGEGGLAWVQDRAQEGGAGAPPLEALWAAVIEPVVALCERLAQQIPVGGSGDRGSGAAVSTSSSAAASSPSAPGQQPLNRFQMLRQAGVRAAVAAQLASVHVLSGGEARRSLFLINCLAALHGPLSVKPALRPWTDPLGARLDAEISRLIEAEAAVAFESSGLLPIIARLERPSPADPPPHPAKLVNALRALAARVALPDALPEYRELEVPRLRALVSGGVARAVVQAYERAYALSKEPGVEAEAAAALGGAPAPMTPGQLRMILNVQ